MSKKTITLPKKWLWVANWKMNLPKEDVYSYLEETDAVLCPGWEVVICPPFTCFGEFQEHLTHDYAPENPIFLGAQNIHHKTSGSYTGEISGAMLGDFCCEHVLIGHSERRKHFGETPELIAQKIRTARRYRLQIILCVGEESSASSWEESLATSLTETLKDIKNPAKLASLLTLAYEPQWAIGAGGELPSKEHIQKALKLLQNTLTKLWDPELAQKVPLLYGGSVDVDFLPTLYSIPLLSGALVGRASLDLDTWTELVSGEVD